MPETWKQNIRTVLAGFRETAHLMVGQPDYRRYRAHTEKHHPERQPMTHTEFVRETMARRYGGKGVGRCC
jgi:uncharacterized short protein YbdD (DUF466 family)